MRLHSLEITAFGPFAEPVTIDFDTLSEASVFLFCGDTGAGKTTVLDAVCFAFYGDVPNERSRAKQLRSHHAAAGAVPRVVLESTVAGRRLRFTRSPAWQRPKKRGTGTTTEQARVLVEELVEGTWRSRTNRLDEAGHLVSDLLGMTLSQFSQVVLLPQGQFDTFLRATSDERHAVLTQLFRTSRFEEVERWLVDRRTTLRRAGEAHRESVTALLHRISEATGTELPVWSPEVTIAAEDGRLAAWTTGLVAAVDRTVQDSRADLGRAVAAVQDATHRLDEGRRHAELRDRHARAWATHERLQATAEAAESGTHQLGRARQASAVIPLIQVSDAASEKATLRARDAHAAVNAVTDLLTGQVDEFDEVDEVNLAGRARDATERAAVARSFLPRARALATTRGRLRELDVRIASLDSDRLALQARLDDFPAQTAALETTITGLRLQAARLPEARLRIIELGKILSRLAILDELTFQVADFGAKRDHQREITLGLRERLADLRERRLHGMASELASAMAVGADCPVCGSVEHPAPARPLPGAPTREDERAVRDQVDTAEVLLETHRDQVRGYQARLDALREELGPRSAEETGTELADAESLLKAATLAERQLVSVGAELATTHSAQRADASALAALETDHRVAEEQRATALRSAADVSRELADLLGEAGDADDLEALARHSERAAGLLSQARESLLEQARSEARADQAHADAARAVTRAGFVDLDQARAAALPAPRLDALQEQVEVRARQEAETRAVLEDPGVEAALRSPAPDLDTLERSHVEATETHLTAATLERAAELRRAQLGELDAALASALARWAPLRRDYSAVSALAELVEGKGVDNTRQMRLSGYVLAARLGQVVAAANERLGRMTDDRYTLEHSATRGVGERRGGLSLLVRDQWTDEQRDPVTLSGGETFVVSLALALGLADVVTGEAGGARIETLFVDEGFGSLDSDTLELVMDTLDELREGGRVVGVVSHVPELRTRIPTQLVVHKTRTGSRLEQCLGAR